MHTGHVGAALVSDVHPLATTDVALPSNPTMVPRRSLHTLHYSGITVETHPCTGAGCLIFYICAITFMLGLLLGIVGYSLLRRLRFRRAIAAGSVPAKMIVSNWNVPAAERGDVEAFSFKVSHPASRAAVKEEGCPICFGTKPNTSSWVVFGACGHATCVSCFKKVASRQRLNAVCPMCRTLLATGQGDRGGKQKKTIGSHQVQQQVGTGQPVATTPSGSDPAPPPPPGSADSV